MRRSTLWSTGILLWLLAQTCSTPASALEVPEHGGLRMIDLGHMLSLAGAACIEASGDLDIGVEVSVEAIGQIIASADLPAPRRRGSSAFLRTMVLAVMFLAGALLGPELGGWKSWCFYILMMPFWGWAVPDLLHDSGLRLFLYAWIVGYPTIHPLVNACLQRRGRSNGDYSAVNWDDGGVDLPRLPDDTE